MSDVGTVKVVKRRQKGEIEVPDILAEPKGSQMKERLAKRAELSISDQVAGHGLSYRNYYWPGGKQAFPSDFRMHHVDKFYPFAQGGPLFVDEASQKEHRDLKAKKEIMEKLGHRYLIIQPNMTLLEATEAIA